MQCQANFDNDRKDYIALELLFWFALISARGKTLDKLLLPRSSRFFALQVIRDLQFQLSHIFDL